MNLNGPQQKQLRDALLDAFPDYDALEQMVRFGLNENLNAIVGPGKLTNVAFDLIKWALTRGRLEELLAAASTENPQNLVLHNVIKQVQTPNTTYTVEQSELEKIVQKSVKFIDIDVWLERLRVCSQAVCRVELSTDITSEVSTGFLLGPNIVITNYHAVESVVTNPMLRNNLLFRFDYKTDEYNGNVHIGVECFLDFRDEWLIASSPVHELDYALLLITTGYTTKRSWLKPQQHTFVSGEPLTIIQHPQGSPMKIATGSITRIDASQNRVHYTVNTLGGSSGSPCFNSDIELVALHQGRSPFDNRGIPFSAILIHLQSKGLLHILGEQGL